jgi:DNA gyrase/topoisomerase IV subunit B
MSINKTEEIIEETQRESIVNRPYNLAGSIKKVTTERFNITKESVEWGESTVVPALLKLFMEGFDNPIDVAEKSGTKLTIDITVNNDSIRIKDNGYGVNTGTDSEGESILYKAFCKYNTSSNYREKKGMAAKGVNGIGVKLCTTLSTKLEVISEDTQGRLKIVATDNNLNHKVSTLKATGKTGVDLTYYPDFSIFEGGGIDEESINRMYEYTLMQSITYPNINFKFNSKKVSMTAHKFAKLFGDDAIVEETDNYFFALLPNELGEFKQLSYINGLEISKGGSHVDMPVQHISNVLRDKLVKKYKTIKPLDIKNKITFVLVGKGMQHIDWEGQVKNCITSSWGAIKQYFKETDLDVFSQKVLRNKPLIENIVDYFKIKEEFKKQKELKSIGKQKKINSENYYPAIKKKKNLVITEGQSALSGIMSPLGRALNSFYTLKGKPLNTITATSQKFTANKELSTLYNIIKNENYDYIIPATDQDLDGIHIRGLLIGFIHQYLPDYKDKIAILNTPVIVIKKNNKVIRWYYSLKDKIVCNKGEVQAYQKGLGSWKEKDLEYVISKDGLDKMIQPLHFDDEHLLHVNNWLEKDSTPRKQLIRDNVFNIAKL